MAANCAILLCSLCSMIDSADERIVAYTDYELCGRTSLYAVSRLKNLDIGWEELTDALGPPDSLGRHSFADLAPVATQMGLFPVAIQGPRESLEKIPLPAILQTRARNGMEHFLVLLRVEENGAWLLDLPAAHRYVNWQEFERIWMGKALVFCDTSREADKLKAMFANGGTHRMMRATLLFILGIIITAALLHGVGWVRRLGRRIGARKIVNQANHKTIIVKSTALAGIFALALLCYSFVGRRLSGADSPTLEFSKKSIDLGELDIGTHTVSIPFQNTGTSDLKIDAVQSSCICTTVEAPRDVEVGHADKLIATIQVSRRPQRVTLLVASNDVNGPQVIELRWIGASAPVLFPPRLKESIVLEKGTKEITRSVRAAYRSDGSVGPKPNIIGIACDNPQVDWIIGKNHPMAFQTSDSRHIGELEVIITVAPLTEPGTIQATCTFQLEYGETEYSLDLPIEVEYVPRLRAHPESLVFTSSSRSQLIGQKSRLTI